MLKSSSLCLKLYRNPTKNLIELKLYMNPTKNLIEDKIHISKTVGELKFSGGVSS